jgi:hypothetical protein
MEDDAGPSGGGCRRQHAGGFQLPKRKDGRAGRHSADFIALLLLTPRFTHAIDYARQIHVGCRKATTVPYVGHLLGFASLVMGGSGSVAFPVTEDMVIAALLTMQ